MGYDKFGLDWNVWGSKKSSGGGSSNPLLDGIGSGWSSSPTQNQGEEEEETAAAGEITAQLRNAKLIPDETTDFNKPCKVQVEVVSKEPVKSQVVINLWGKYKEEEYNLQHEIKVDPKDGIAQGELKLFYVDAYYDDVASGATGENVFYIAKCSLKGANPVDSEPLQMPLVQGITLLFEDDDGMPISNVKVTIASGKEFLSGEDGKVLIPAEADGSEVEVVKIEIDEAQSCVESINEQPTSDSQTEQVNQESFDDTPVVPGAPVDNIVSDDNSSTTEEKKTVILFKDNTGKVLANAKVILSDGRSYTSDDKGEVSIAFPEGQSEEMNITSIELATA